MNKFLVALTALISFLPFSANAVISIDITRGNVDPMPIALPYLAPEGADANGLGQKIIEVVENDLETSGLFRSINRSAFLQEITGSSTMPIFPSWRQVNAAAVLTGGIKFPSSNDFETEFRLWDVFAEQQVAGKSYGTKNNNWRRIAHLMSDEIYKRLTGEEGYFDSRIVYISESGSGLNRVKRLAIMDQDGANHRFLTDGNQLVLTPRFSATAQKVIYMSYSEDVPKVYMIDVDTKQRELIGNFPGMSFAPRFSPNGDTVVLSAAWDGNSEIYSYNMKTGQKKRLTNDGAIDTSPSYSPDGTQIVFNSDRGGSQQLYTMDTDGGNVKRISFGNGRYGTPVWSPRGDLIAFTKMSQGQFYIGIMRLDGTGERLLTQSFMDEGPTWSPNGRVLTYFKERGDSSTIYTIDVTGYNERTLKTSQSGSDPAWSPINK